MDNYKVFAGQIHRGGCNLNYYNLNHCVNTCMCHYQEVGDITGHRYSNIYCVSLYIIQDCNGCF